MVITNGHSTPTEDGTRHRLFRSSTCLLLTYSDEIRSAVLMIHGEKAHSRYFSEDAYKAVGSKDKELYIVPGANHTDLYDNTEKIPFDKFEQFFKDHLK